MEGVPQIRHMKTSRAVSMETPRLTHNGNNETGTDTELIPHEPPVARAYRVGDEAPAAEQTAASNKYTHAEDAEFEEINNSEAANENQTEAEPKAEKLHRAGESEPQTESPPEATASDPEEIEIRFHPDAESLRESMSAHGREMAGWVYEHIYRSKTGDRIFGRAEVLVHGFFARRLRGSELDAAKALAIAQKELETQKRIEATLQARLDGLTDETIKATLAKDMERLAHNVSKAENKVSQRENILRAKQYNSEAQQRKLNQSANKITRRTEEALRPYEDKQNLLERRQQEVELRAAALEIHHRGHLEQVAQLKVEREDLMHTLNQIGPNLFDNNENWTKNHPSMRALDAMITELQRMVDKDTDALEKERVQINQKLAKMQKAAAPYQATRAKYDSLKKAFETPAVEAAANDNRSEADTGSTTSETGAESTAEQLNPTIKEMTDSWNRFVNTLPAAERQPLAVQAKELVTNAWFVGEQTRMKQEDFTNLLKLYLKTRRPRITDIDRKIEAFIKKLAEPETGANPDNLPAAA